MMAEAQHDSLLYLNAEPIRFEPVNKVTAVFFDETNKQIFSVRSGGATGVVVKSLDASRNTSFRMEDRGPVISIKYSPDMKVLAIQRFKTSVEFVTRGSEAEYAQCCRSKNAIILDFFWVADTELVYVTDRGVEHYQVLPARRQLKSLKTCGVSSNWCVFSSELSYLLVSTGTLGNTLQPFSFRAGTMTKLAKFDVELLETPRPARLALHSHDVTVSQLSGQLTVLALLHAAPSSPSSPGSGAGAEVRVYQAGKDGAMQRTSTLLLNARGNFATSILDNLVIVHHQESKTSQVFDLSLPCSDDAPGAVASLQRPVAPPASIRPFQLRLSTGAAALDSPEAALLNCELYAPTWVVFQPNIIIDAQLGCFWTLQLCVAAVPAALPDPVPAARLLLARSAGRPVLLRLLRRLLLAGGGRLADVGAVLDLLNEQTQRQLEHTVSSQMGTPVSAIGSSPSVPATRAVPFVITQTELLSEVLSDLVTGQQGGEADQRWVTGVLVECVRSLTQHGLPVDHFLYEMLITTLVLRGCFYQLQQLLQYHAVEDSKPLACLLLSLQSVYPAAEQMALDMLQRLGNADEEIIEIMLSRNDVTSALRYARDKDMIAGLPARKILDAAKNTGDADIFYTTFRFFEERNYRTRGRVDFSPGDHCELYVRHFSQLFGVPSSLRDALEASQRRDDGMLRQRMEESGLL